MVRIASFGTARTTARDQGVCQETMQVYTAQSLTWMKNSEILEKL